MIEIEKVSGGYILTHHGKTVFPSFNALVQYLARHFNEVGIGEDWVGGGNG